MTPALLTDPPQPPTCQHCGAPLQASVSDDVCSETCHHAWHAAHTTPPVVAAGADRGQPLPTPDPVRPGSTLEPAPEVLEGELLPEDGDDTALAIRRASPAAVVPRVRALARVVSTTPGVVHLRGVLAHRVRHAPRDARRVCWFALRGHARWISKAWRWATYGDLRADARAARLAGDAQARRVAQELIRADAQQRWTKAGRILRRGVSISLLLTTLGGVLALIHAQVPRERMWPWLAMVYTLLALTGTILVWVLKLTPIAWFTAAVWEGRDRTPGVGFLTRPSAVDPDSWIDERIISQALAHLGIAPLDRFFKNGGVLVYTIAARLDGTGTFAQIRLPMGVTAEIVTTKRATLAANLGRAVLETWPTQGPEAGILDLWIADKGKLGTGAGPWPLLHDGTVDVFEGVPLGKTQRGAIVLAPLFEANYLIGGRPGQGKSAALRTLLLGAALDPTAELWVFVMGQSPDFTPFGPRLSRYAMGMDDAVAEAAMQALADLLAEMERRGKVLEHQPGSPPKTSRKLATKPSLGLHWLGCWIDECHELFQHPHYGAQAAEWAIRLIKRGRKYGISLLLATQSPTKDSIPREVTRNISCGLAFSVADHVANDGLLGSGKYRAGIRATELRMTTDRGTCVAVGLTDATFELLTTFYIPYDDDTDHITPVITRAMTQITHLRHTGARPQTETGPEPVDALADIATVLGTDRRTRTQVLLTRLAEHNPTHYEGWTFTDLKTTLATHGIEPGKSHGVMVIDADDITHALTHRHHHSDTESDDDPGS
jgi:DNA segregation ATPase FtsK/SpoIIIE, S-DNA-T family